MLYPKIGSAVVGLNFLIDNTAILWRVTLVVIYPINGTLTILRIVTIAVPIRSLCKRFGIIFPLVTHRYSATAVSRITFIFLVTTTIFYLAPYLIYS